ncbi:MAG: mandelate racemase/muconate lactonizing enzyme family protein [Betaproteobacteria bacterium]|nr:mandelate racemase/muconate lactonizing enzyme family protein [Betaproteobacteria bacterium]
MSRIVDVEVFQVDLASKVKRGDAIQAFPKQETPMVRIRTDDGAEGVGYTYTIGTGGSSVVALIRDHLAPQLVGQESAMVERIWRQLYFHTHATAVGAITSLALCAIDTALWDLRGKRAGLPLHILAGGAQERVPVYDTEGGWLHMSTKEIVANAERMRSAGFGGVKIKVGKPRGSDDVKRLAAVRKAIGGGMELMVDANQGFTVAEAIRRARQFEALDLAWFEEPLPADDISGHALLRQSTSLPIAVGESIYSISHFREYLQHGACTIVQVDVARIGGITPWLKCAHLAESFNVPVCPHYLMELHVGLCAAVPNAPWVEHIPQLDVIMKNAMRIRNGFAYPFEAAGLGIEWDWKAIGKRLAGPPHRIGR